MFGNMGYGELLIVGFLILLLFGAKRLPEIGSSLGKGIREFKSSVRDVEAELKTPRYTPPPLPEPRRTELPGAAAAAAAAAPPPAADAQAPATSPPPAAEKPAGTSHG